jgi:hypothetical protein
MLIISFLYILLCVLCAYVLQNNIKESVGQNIEYFDQNQAKVFFKKAKFCL